MPPPGHRVARIDREIDDDLLELALVDLDEAEIAAVHDLQLDVLADQPAQQMRQLDQHVGDVEDARLQGLLAREGQELAHQIGGAVGVLLDLHDVGEGRVARPEAHQQEVAEADHRRQQVVEIVRDAAGELADRLHLLRLGELHLEVLLLGDVDEMQDQPAVAAARGSVEPARGRPPRLLSRAALEAHLDRPGMRRAVGRGGELDRDLAAVLLVDEADQRLADQILRPGAEQFAERAVRLLEPAEAVDQRDADRRVGEEALEALARQPQRALPFALGGQVAHHRAGAQLVARRRRRSG